MEFAPILISVYNRDEHFKKCIESLKENKLADKSPLFVAIDAPFRDEDIEKNNKVVSYAKRINGFKEITIFVREKNFGIRENLSSARREIFSAYDTLIFSEDDNIFAPDFLDFINKGLKIYKDRENILAICGYNYPVKIPKKYNKDVYLWKGMSAWGYGTWKDKIAKVEWDEQRALKEVREFLKRPKDVINFSKIANHYLQALLMMDYKKKMFGDSYLCLFQYLNDMYSVFPVNTKVKNIGHDGSGLNCKIRVNDEFTNQELADTLSNFEFPKNISDDELINSIMSDFFKAGLLKNGFFKSLLLLYKLGYISLVHRIIKLAGSDR